MPSEVILSAFVLLTVIATSCFRGLMQMDMAPWLWHLWQADVGIIRGLVCKRGLNSVQIAGPLRWITPISLNPLMLLIDLKVSCLSLEMSPSPFQEYFQATRINTSLRLSILGSDWQLQWVYAPAPSTTSELRSCWNLFLSMNIC